MKKLLIIGLFVIANGIANDANAEIVAVHEDVALAAKEQMHSLEEQISAIGQQAKKVATDVQKEVADKIEQLNKHLKDLELQEKAMRGLKRVRKYAQRHYDKIADQAAKTKEYLYKQLIKHYKKPKKKK